MNDSAYPAEFTDYAINLTDIGDGDVNKSTQIIFESEGTIEEFFTFYRAEAEKLGWTEAEALGAGSESESLKTISFTIPDFPDSERGFSVNVFENKGTARRSKGELSIAVSGSSSELGKASDNLNVAAVYEGLTEIEAKDLLRALGEESVNFVLTKGDLKIDYQIIAIETPQAKRATIKARVNFVNP